VAECGWVNVVVDSHLGSQSGYPATPGRVRMQSAGGGRCATVGDAGGRAEIAVADGRTVSSLPLVPRSAAGAHLLRPARRCSPGCTAGSRLAVVICERHAGLGVCAWKAHGSCGLVHGVCKDRKCSFLYGV
jgi:hypothetical protein